MVYILLGQGFEEIEAIAPADLLRRAGIKTAYAGIGGRDIAGGTGLTVRADLPVEKVDRDDLDMLVLPGGLGGVASIKGSGKAIELIKCVYESGKPLAALCAAPTVLAGLGMLKGRKAVCYPAPELEKNMDGAIIQKGERVVVDGSVITGSGPGSAIEFGLKLIEVLAGREASENVRGSIVYDR